MKERIPIEKFRQGGMTMTAHKEFMEDLLDSEEMPINLLGTERWQKNLMRRILEIQDPWDWDSERINDLVMLISNPDVAPRLKRVLVFLLDQ